MELSQSRQILVAGFDKLSGSDRDFAYSLLQARFLSTKQAHWVGVLAERVQQADKPRETVGNIAGVVDLIGQGRLNLKHPVVRFVVGDLVLRVTVASDRSSTPGALNVTDTGSFEDRSWFGKVTPEGEWIPSRKVASDTQTAILAALRALAVDPAGVAAAWAAVQGVLLLRHRSVRSSLGDGGIRQDMRAQLWSAVGGEVMAIYKASIVLLVDVDGEGEACDCIAEALRPLLRRYTPASSVVEWSYGDPCLPCLATADDLRLIED